jgi:hypothetical protein
MKKTTIEPSIHFEQVEGSDHLVKASVIRAGKSYSIKILAIPEDKIEAAEAEVQLLQTETSDR